jgi:hypothetical protein
LHPGLLQDILDGALKDILLTKLTHQKKILYLTGLNLTKYKKNTKKMKNSPLYLLLAGEKHRENTNEENPFEKQ